MNFSVKTIPKFDREIKKLAAKYHSLKEEYILLIESLSETPIQGVSLGNNCYKIRLSIKSKGKGKSGGARVVAYVQIEGKTVYLLTIFDKNEKENIADNELKELLKFIPN